MSHGPSPHSTRAPNALPQQNLTDEGLLHKAARDAAGRPLMGGIPLIAKVGQGGMGAVYYGIHPRLNLEVAVKVLPFHLADRDPDLIRRFFGEAQIAARVQSDHIVRVLDVNEEAGVYYLVMEFVRGLSAAGVLKKLQKGESVAGIAPAQTTGGQPALPVAAALAIVTAASRGLMAAHAQDVIHRDIKPDNIFIPRGPQKEAGVEPPLICSRAKLGDLGLAKQDDGHSMGTLSQMAMGTPGYMAPEQVRDAKRATKRSDVFSMGAALYALLTGRLPFAGTGVGDILIKTVSVPHDPVSGLRPDVPGPVVDLIDWCLDKEPERRPQDGAALVQALEAVQAAVGSGVSAAPIGGGATGPQVGAVGAAGAAGVGSGLGAAHGSSRPFVGPGSGGPQTAMPTAAAASTAGVSDATGVTAAKSAGGSAGGLAGAGATPATAWSAEGLRPGPVGPTSPLSAQGVAPQRSRSRLGLWLVLLLAVLALGGGGLWYWQMQSRDERSYQWLIQDSRATMTQAQAEYRAGRVTAEQYENQLLNANNGYAAALKLFPGREEAETGRRQADELLLALRDARAEASVAAKTKFLALLAQAQRAEPAAVAEKDTAKAIAAWTAVRALYREAQALQPEDTVCRGALARAEERLGELTRKTDSAVQVFLVAAQTAVARAEAGGDLAQKQQAFTEALTSYAGALALRPDDAEIKLKRARVSGRLMDLDRYVEEINEATQALEQAVKAGEMAQLQLDLAVAQKHVAKVQALKFDGAADRLAGRLKELQAYAEKLTHGLKLQAAGNNPEALAIFKAALGFVSDGALGNYLLGLGYYRALAEDETFSPDLSQKIGVYFERATLTQPNYAAAWLAWGRLLKRSETAAGDPNADEEPMEAGYLAIAKFERATQTDPQSVEAWTALAEQEYEWAGLSRAVYAYEQACRIRSADAALWTRMGQIQMEAACPALALTSFEMALRAAPEDPAARRGKAQALADLGRPVAAEAAYAAALAVDPESTELAELRQEQADTAAAYKASREYQAQLRKRLAMGDQALDNYFALAAEHRYLAQYREERAVLQQAAQVHGASAALCETLATSHSMLQEYEAAAALAAKAAELAPGVEQYATTRDLYRTAWEDAQQRARKIAEWQAKVEADPDDRDAYYELCWALYEDGRYAEAVEWTRAGLARWPGAGDLQAIYYDAEDMRIREAAEPEGD